MLICFPLTPTQNTAAAFDMSEENFVTFSADLTEQDYLTFSVSGTKTSSELSFSPLMCCTAYERRMRVVLYALCVHIIIHNDYFCRI